MASREVIFFSSGWCGGNFPRRLHSLIILFLYDITEEMINLLQGDDISRISTAAKIVERMVNQNTYDDIAQGNF